jgi:hypothetical protein
MHAQEHSTIREGLVTGILGAVVLAVWYLGSDAIHGQVLHTPNVLGKIFVAGDTAARGTSIAAGAVAGYAAFHVVAFLISGILLAWGIHAAMRHPSLRTGVVIAIVVGLGIVYTVLFMAPPFVRDPSLRWSVVLGALVAGIAMLIYLWRRHPALTQQVQETEVPGPSHPPGPQAG